MNMMMSTVRPLTCGRSASGQSRDQNDSLTARFKRFIQEQAFPCVGAKSALQASRLEVMVAEDVASPRDDLLIYPSLLAFAQAYANEPVLFQSFAVIFQGPVTLSEAEFERHLWSRVQALTDKDVQHGQVSDLRVSPDPDEPDFSLSFGGQGFFVVGLHPNASRRARRFECPTLVFNLHDQFTRLRAEGRYEKLRSSILARDDVFSGGMNPMLRRHGEGSEARQYSGRVVDADWSCPFHRPDAQNDD